MSSGRTAPLRAAPGTGSAPAGDRDSGQQLGDHLLGAAPAECAASAVSSRRWASTGVASSWTSSGRTWSRPDSAADARAARRAAGRRGGTRPAAGGRAPGGLDDGDHVATDGLGDVQLPDGGHEVRTPPRRRPGQGGERVGGLALVQHRQLRDAVGVAHRHPRGEPVALGLGQGIGPSISSGFCVAMTRNGRASS